jgi:hypothetical protein
MSQPDIALARRIFALTSSFYFYMFFMTLAAAEAVLAFLVTGITIPRTTLAFPPLITYFPLGSIAKPVVSFVTLILSLVVLILSPTVLFSVWNTWGSLSRWRRSFLRFSIMANIESVPFEALDPRDKLLEAILSANPDYDRILHQPSKSLQEDYERSRKDDLLSEGGEEGAEVFEPRRPSDIIPPEIFKKLSITHKGRKVVFDILIGLAPRYVRDTTGRSHLLLLRQNWVASETIRRLSEIGVTAGRVIDGKLDFGDYRVFANDLKLLASYSDTRVLRGFLVSTEPPDQDVVDYARDRRNWPRHNLARIPIVVLVPQDNGYEIAVLAS